ncbi:ubiquitin hydrolase [Trypanosoma conorhini]|uniref:ubiquitinyl hydrolase 1 n=1 Tax=Trypanosoma conorhini TaxID=83891 RepID=A0A3R7M495_9TRYP|nr:ubiquitin hydrolase [Trypanosoma conorhini]RNF26262.1 ubiquitin hydrolase [Trypanosoma conorhini]
MQPSVLQRGSQSGPLYPLNRRCPIQTKPQSRSFSHSASSGSRRELVLPKYSAGSCPQQQSFPGHPRLLPLSVTTSLPMVQQMKNDRQWKPRRPSAQPTPAQAAPGGLSQPQFLPQSIQQAKNSLTSQAATDSDLHSSRGAENYSPIPLRNFGNTCYMNSVIQCILHSPWLFARLAKVNKGRRLCPATSALLELNGPNVSSSRQLLLIIKNEAAKFNAEFQYNEQSDAHEFLRTLLFVVHSEVNVSGGNNAPYEEVEDVEDEKEEAAMQRWREHFLRIDNSVIYDLFGGVMRSKCVCSRCKKESLTFDPFLDLSLPMMQSAKEAMTIEAALKANFDDVEEKLRGGNQLLCARCKGLRDGKRSLKIKQWPKILVLHLKRFSDTGRKNSGPVVFPELFTTHDYTPQYQLYGVVCHSGSEHWGHYTSYVRTLSGQWYHCNDGSIVHSTVMEATRALALAYVLFYAAT